MSSAPRQRHPITGLWLGFLWGLCMPLLVSSEGSRFSGILRISIPLCLIVFVALHVWLRKLIQNMDAASTAPTRILAPLALVCLAPLSILFAFPAWPFFIAFVAVALSLFRFLDCVSRHDSERERIAISLLLVLFVICFIALFEVNIVHDAFQYYGYLASLIIDGDLNLYDEIYLHNSFRMYNPFPQASGRYIGTALAEMPAFMLGHWTAGLLNSLGAFHPRTGYSAPYFFWVSLSSCLFGFTGVVFTYAFVRSFFSRSTSLLAVCAVWLASSLVFFSFCWNGWSHPYAFCYTAAFLLLWQRSRGARTLRQWILLGVLAGLIGITRPTAGLIVLLPVVETFLALRRNDGPCLDRQWILGALAATAIALCVFSPQLSLWKAISGSWFASPYGEVGDAYTWLQPDFAGILFSAARHGLFVWTPVLLPSALGLFLLWRKDRLVASIACILILATTYLYACWTIWWTGIGFSNRFFISLTPFFALGLAALIHWLRRYARLDFIVGLLAFAVIWNLFLVGNYRRNTIPQGIPDPARVIDQPLTLAQIVTAQVQTGPGHFPDLFLGHWIHSNFALNKIVHAVRYGHVNEFLLVCIVVALAGSVAFGLLRWILRKHATVRIGSRLISILVVGITLAVHCGIMYAAGRTTGFHRFYRFDEVDISVRSPAADTYIYSDYPLPVTAVDLVTHLSRAHRIEQGRPVAMVSIIDRDGREHAGLLRAGIETAETSALRPEARALTQHDLARTEVVRARSSVAYSDHVYDLLAFRATIDLPAPMIVKGLRLRYLHPVGELTVADIFLRDF